MKVEFVLNGKRVQVEGHPLDRLLDVLREQFDLTGTKECCGEGECGACTVLLDDEPVLACLMPLMQCHDRQVQSIEGIVACPEAGKFLNRFVQDGATQCGACTPGIIVAGWKMTRRRSRLSRRDIRRALAGNLCRCTGYEAILKTLTRKSPS